MTGQNFSHPLIGCRVEIRNSRPRYGGKCDGACGQVCAVFGADNIAVLLDTMRNGSSSRGWYYFRPTELDVIEGNTPEQEKGDTTMQPMKNYVNIAEVHFLDSDPIHPKAIWAANYDTALEVGDVCVVATAHHGLALAEVVAIHENLDQEIFREIVSRVDMFPYRFRVEQRQKAAELKAKMQERAKKLQDIALFQTLAKDDPEMAQMLQEYLGVTV